MVGKNLGKHVLKNLIVTNLLLFGLIGCSSFQLKEESTKWEECKKWTDAEVWSQCMVS